MGRDITYHVLSMPSTDILFDDVRACVRALRRTKGDVRTRAVAIVSAEGAGGGGGHGAWGREGHVCVLTRIDQN